ncbi:MAG: M48 family metallopeptidase, partial [Actinobacteria bacterium]|nr:M48 family metallopeptidase [Actinomycetota bacterium]
MLPGMVSPDAPAVEVDLSARRRRTVSAYRDGDRVVVLIPARFTKAEEQEWVRRMVARVVEAQPRRRAGRGDAELARRAAELSARYLDGRARPSSVRWVPPMRTRWASCTPADGTIRLSRA